MVKHLKQYVSVMKDAEELEQALIRDLNPKYNRRGHKCASDVAGALGITTNAARLAYLPSESALRDKVESTLVPS